MRLPYTPLGALHSALAGIQQMSATEADGGCSVAQLRAWMITHPSIIIEERATSAEELAHQLQIDKLALLTFCGSDGLSARDISDARIQLLGLASVYMSRMNLLSGTELRDYAPHTGLGVDQQALA